MEVNAGLFTGSYKENEFLFISSHREILEETCEELQTIGVGTCQICADDVGLGENGELFVACNECGFPVCKTCYDYERREGNQVCPRCKTRYRRLRGCARVPGDEDEDNVDDIEHEFNLMVSEFLPEQQAIVPAYSVSSPCSDQHQLVPSQPRALDPSRDLAVYGYGSVTWKERMENWKQKKDLSIVKHENGGDDLDDVDQGFEHDLLLMDEGRLPLSRKLPIPSSQMNPYRMVMIIRLIVTGFFFHYRIKNPVKDAYALWLVSVICEIWFAIMWLLDQLPKWLPVDRETYLDRLALRYEKTSKGCELPAVDIFVTTVDTSKEPPLVTANTVLSILALDYPTEKVTCYVSDDGADMLTFEALSETSEFACKWVPFCKRFNIEPRAPECYFAKKVDYLKDKMIFTEFIKERRSIKREYEEFKVRMNGLVAKAQKVPEGGWTMQDGTPWPGNNREDHPGMIQVFLGQRAGRQDIDGNALPRLIYVSREKRPYFDNHKKAGSMNALVRVSAVLTNAPYLLNVDCDVYISNSKALREAMCFLMDSWTRKKACFVQFSHKSHGIDGHDPCANMNVAFRNINMKGLDGIQGPTYTGSGCVFRRNALYGFHAPKLKASGRAWSCWPKWFCFGRSARKENKIKSISEDDNEVNKHDKPAIILEQNLEKRFGTSQILTASIFEENGGRELANLDPASLLKEAIHVISCGYEDKTDWGKEVGWIYGPDILTSFGMHRRGWRSIFCDPPIPAFRGPAPINLSDHLQQVVRSALGSVEISLSSHNPIWYGYRGGLKWLEHVAYINAAVYPFASFPLVAYCILPAVCLVTGQFIIPELSYTGSIWFVSLFMCIFATNILEMKWSGLGMEDWWRNEQCWVIEGVSSHVLAVFQGLFQVVSGIETSDIPVAGLLVPPTTLLLLNVIGVVAGTSSAIQSRDGSWAPLFGKLFFAFWVIIHLYPLLKGLLGRNNRTPTIVLVWSVMIASIFSLLWVRLDPFLAGQDGPLLEECGLDCS